MQNYPNNIKKKLISISDLSKKLKLSRKRKKISLCHGTFDIVHPGHIRHLMYAKQKSDILIVSITKDKFITKSKDGPFVPEELRVRNLAFLEIVDYVIIDDYAKPINLISKIKPDYFIKPFSRACSSASSLLITISTGTVSKLSMILWKKLKS